MDVITHLFPWITNGPLIAVQVMSGLSVGMFLFLVSVGMSLIFGVTRIVNLAHGSFYMVSAYLMVTLVEWLPEGAGGFWIALVVAPIGVAILGGVIEVTLLRRIYHRDPMMQLILTFGLILHHRHARPARVGPRRQTCPGRRRSPAPCASSASRSPPTTCSSSGWLP